MIPDPNMPIKRHPNTIKERISQAVWNFPDKAGGFILEHTSYVHEGELRALLLERKNTERNRRRAFTKAMGLTAAGLVSAAITLDLIVMADRDSDIKPNGLEQTAEANLSPEAEAERTLEKCLDTLPPDVMAERPELNLKRAEDISTNICQDRYEETMQGIASGFED